MMSGSSVQCGVSPNATRPSSSGGPSEGRSQYQIPTTLDLLPQADLRSARYSKRVVSMSTPKILHEILPEQEEDRCATVPVQRPKSASRSLEGYSKREENRSVNQVLNSSNQLASEGNPLGLSSDATGTYQSLDTTPPYQSSDAVPAYQSSESTPAYQHSDTTPYPQSPDLTPSEQPLESTRGEDIVSPVFPPLKMLREDTSYPNTPDAVVLQGIPEEGSVHTSASRDPEPSDDPEASPSHAQKEDHLPVSQKSLRYLVKDPVRVDDRLFDYQDDMESIISSSLPPTPSVLCSINALGKDFRHSGMGAVARMIQTKSMRSLKEYGHQHGLISLSQKEIFTIQSERENQIFSKPQGFYTAYSILSDQDSRVYCCCCYYHREYETDNHDDSFFVDNSVVFAPTCLFMLSVVPCPLVLCAVLEDYMHALLLPSPEKAHMLTRFLLRDCLLPVVNKLGVEFRLNNHVYTLSLMNINTTIVNCCDCRMLFEVFSTDTIISLFLCILTERKMLFVSNKIALLPVCIFHYSPL